MLRKTFVINPARRDALIQLLDAMRCSHSYTLSATQAVEIVQLLQEHKEHEATIRRLKVELSDELPQFVRWHGRIYRRDPSGAGDDAQYHSAGEWRESFDVWSRVVEYGTPCTGPQEI